MIKILHYVQDDGESIISQCDIYSYNMLQKKSWINPHITIREVNSKGKGMFAIRSIKAGETVVIFGGKYINAKEVKIAKDQNKLVMQWDDDLFSVEDPGDDPTYFINHSCDPNIWMKDAFTIIARRDIKFDEELTADYALWEADENHISKWACMCGSPLCRSKVTGKDWKLPELQKRYKNHFTPLINKRIKNIQNKINNI